MAIVIEKQWDGNECETDGANGRIYVSRGRWQWVVIVDGVPDSMHDLKREAAVRRAEILRERAAEKLAHTFEAIDADEQTAMLAAEGARVRRSRVRVAVASNGVEWATHPVCVHIRGCAACLHLRPCETLAATVRAARTGGAQ